MNQITKLTIGIIVFVSGFGYLMLGLFSIKDIFLWAIPGFSLMTGGLMYFGLSINGLPKFNEQQSPNEVEHE